MGPRDQKDLVARNRELQIRLEEAEETLRALRSGEVDAIVAQGPDGEHVYTLRGADETYRVMVEGMAEGAVTLTRDGLILFSNEQFASILGAPLENVTGSPIYRFVVDDDAPVLSALLAGPDRVKAEVRFESAMGAVPTHVSAATLVADGNECICLIVTDLTEQRRNEEIAAAERLARAILDQAAGAILVVDRTGRVIRASRAADTMAGGIVLLRPLDEVLHLRSISEDAEWTFAEIFSAVERHGSIEGIEAVATFPDGRAVDVLMNASLLASDRSEPLGCIVMLSDVSGLRRAEKALSESESRVRTLGDNLPEVAIYRYVHGLDGKPRFEFISAGIEKLTGIPAAEVMRDAESFDRTMAPDDLARLTSEIAISRQHLTRLETEIRHVHRITGELRWSLLRSMPSRCADGSTAWEGIQFDITDRKRAEVEIRVREERLRQAQKMESIGVLAGGIAHDFNNLLTGVIGNASMLRDSIPTWDRNRDHVEALISCADRAADLTRQLLAYAGKGRFIIRKVNLSEAVREMSALLRGSVPAIIGIDFDLEEEIAPVEADAGQIQQIIMNLVLNAAEAIGDRSGQITIQTGNRNLDQAAIDQSQLEIPAGHYVSLEVQDTGPGMDEATKAKIFEPFFTTKFQGRGLGLAAVHGIVRAHKGAILVYSHPGHGAHFTVLLPAAGVGSSKRTEITSSPHDLHGHDAVLVVDDEEAVRIVAKAALEHFGYRVLLARNGIEAVEVFRKAPDQISVVLLDLTMPLMSGEETFRRLRAVRADVPIVISSGYNQIEVIKRFTGQRLAGFLGKPYSATTLVAKIKETCGSSA